MAANKYEYGNFNGGGGGLQQRFVRFVGQHLEHQDQPSTSIGILENSRSSIRRAFASGFLKPGRHRLDRVARGWRSSRSAVRLWKTGKSRPPKTVAPITL
jgi:hypothetical protein